MAEHPAVSEQRKRKLKAAKRQTPGLLAFVADETGLLKEVTATESKPAVRRFRAQDRTKAIQDMCFAPTAVGELEKEVRKEGGKCCMCTVDAVNDTTSVMNHVVYRTCGGHDNPHLQQHRSSL